jgi:FMN phosphatase YigB (HAD superfamily)
MSTSAPNPATRGTPEVILFDVGNTLLFPNWGRILAPLIAIGVTTTREQLQAIERKTKKQFDDEMKSARGKVDHSFWEIFYDHLLELLQLPDANLRQQLTNATRLSANWNIIRPGTREVLQRLSRRYHIGVISNADGKIDEVLTQCKIGDCFLHITDSGIVGHEKPHPAIFAAAFGKGESRSRTGHVRGGRLFRRLPWRNQRGDASHLVRCLRRLSERWIAARGIAPRTRGTAGEPLTAISRRTLPR